MLKIILVTKEGMEINSFSSSFIPPENSIIKNESMDDFEIEKDYIVSSAPEIIIENGKVQRVILAVTEV